MFEKFGSLFFKLVFLREDRNRNNFYFGGRTTKNNKNEKKYEPLRNRFHSQKYF